MPNTWRMLKTHHRLNIMLAHVDRIPYLLVASTKQQRSHQSAGRNVMPDCLLCFHPNITYEASIVPATT
eukprot:scaffold81729_cov20-Prasinocladus_malaysianus.AAC.1